IGSSTMRIKLTRSTSKLRRESGPFQRGIAASGIAELFDCVARFNTILIDFDRDVWVISP
ncbi:hypothetical protein C2U36_26625, partial [Escherichia coli]